MSDAAVEAILPVLRREGDPRLPQYIAYLHSPRSGWSLGKIGQLIGLSREWTRQLEVRGLQEVADGKRLDLVGLPTFTPKKWVQTRGRQKPFVLPEATAEVLRAMNRDCTRFRGGGDPTVPLAFAAEVKRLVDNGVPMTSIARAVGSNPQSFAKRMRRWDVYSNGGPSANPNMQAPTEERRNQALLKVVSRDPQQQSPAPEPVAETIQPRPATPARATRGHCRWPDCPINSGTGPCIHP